MDLHKPTRENIVFIIDALRSKLAVINGALLDSDDYSIEDYEDLHDLYEMIYKRQNMSISEMEGVVAELGSLRKKKKDRD